MLQGITVTPVIIGPAAGTAVLNLVVLVAALAFIATDTSFFHAPFIAAIVSADAFIAALAILHRAALPAADRMCCPTSLPTPTATAPNLFAIILPVPLCFTCIIAIWIPNKRVIATTVVLLCFAAVPDTCRIAIRFPIRLLGAAVIPFFGPAIFPLAVPDRIVRAPSCGNLFCAQKQKPQA